MMPVLLAGTRESAYNRGFVVTQFKFSILYISSTELLHGRKASERPITQDHQEPRTVRFLSPF